MSCVSVEIQLQNDTQVSCEIGHRFGCGHSSSQKKNPNKEKYLVESLTKTMAKRYTVNREKNWEGKDLSFLSKLWAVIGYGGNNGV